MDINEALEGLKSEIESDLDMLLGGRKAVCPHCGKITHLVKETNVLAPHVYMIDTESLDFEDILSCPASGTTVSLLEDKTRGVGKT